MKMNADGSVTYTQENGIETKVDSDVIPWLRRVWLVRVKKGQYLAFVRNKKTHYLHREISGCPDLKTVDHINGDTFDNRRSNLRICSNTENVRHRVVLNSNNTSGKVGVFYNRKRDYWEAGIKHNRKKIFLGRFSKIEDAIKARKMAEIRLWGQFAPTV